VAAPYPWPVKPFDRQHPVRGFFNDPRVQDASHAFHFGIDVSAPDGTAVYAVTPGKVFIEDKGHAVAVQAPDGRAFGYWHMPMLLGIIAVAAVERARNRRRTPTSSSSSESTASKTSGWPPATRRACGTSKCPG